MKLPDTNREAAGLGRASRRGWLKGLGALLGTGLLAAPAALLAQPVAAPAAGAAQVGGDEYIGMVKLLAGTVLPPGWALCDGRELLRHEHPALLAVLGGTYGGDGRHTFCLPDLREDTPTGSHPEATPAPPTLRAIKVANAPATSGALAELHLEHRRRRLA